MQSRFNLKYQGSHLVPPQRIFKTLGIIFSEINRGLEALAAEVGGMTVLIT